MFYKLSFLIFLVCYIFRNLLTDSRGTKTTCNVVKAAGSLRDAMKGIGTDEMTIIKTLTDCNNDEMQAVADTYEYKFERKLIDDLKSDLSGKFRDAVIEMIQPLPLFFAKELAYAIYNNEYDTIIEILFSRSNKEIDLIQTAYLKAFQRNLTAELKSKTLKSLSFLLEGLSYGNRDESNNVSYAKAEADAKDLISNSSTEVWAPILSRRNFIQLNATFERFKAMSCKSISDSIQEKMTTPMKEACLDIVNFISNGPEYFASRIYGAVNHFYIDDRSLTRVILSRWEIDLKNVTNSFQMKFGKKIEAKISYLICDDYCKLIKAILESVDE